MSGTGSQFNGPRGVEQSAAMAQSAAAPRSAATQPIIRFRDVHKSFGRLPVLRGIDLDIAEGERVVIAGPSGSGKSTLIRCINRLELTDRGELIVNGIHVDRTRIDVDQL